MISLFYLSFDPKVPGRHKEVVVQSVDVSYNNQNFL